MQEVNRTEMIRAAATPLECEALALLAQSENVRPSEMVRLLIRERAKQAGLWPLQNTRAPMCGEERGKVG